MRNLKRNTPTSLREKVEIISTFNKIFIKKKKKPLDDLIIPYIICKI